MLASRRHSQLMIVDVQEKLAPHVDRHVEILDNCQRLMRYARRLGVPVTITEHYPKGLGHTVATLRAAAGNEARTLEKITFSCLNDQAIAARLREQRARDRTQVVVAGMEAHVCVGQTVLDLIDNEFEVFVVADAVGSRSPDVCRLALERMERKGAQIVSHEMVAFEWLGRGDTAEFKDLIGVIK